MPAKKAYAQPNQGGGRGPGGPPGNMPTLQPPRQGAPIGGRPGGGGSRPIEPPGWPPPGAEVPPVMPPNRGAPIMGGPGNPWIPGRGGTPIGGGGPIDPAAIRAALAAKLAASGAGAPLSTPDPLQAALMKLKLGGGL